MSGEWKVRKVWKSCCQTIVTVEKVELTIFYYQQDVNHVIFYTTFIPFIYLFCFLFSLCQCHLFLLFMHCVWTFCCVCEIFYWVRWPWNWLKKSQINRLCYQCYLNKHHFFAAKNAFSLYLALILFPKLQEIILIKKYLTILCFITFCWNIFSVQAFCSIF